MICEKIKELKLIKLRNKKTYLLMEMSILKKIRKI